MFNTDPWCLVATHTAACGSCVRVDECRTLIAAAWGSDGHQRRGNLLRRWQGAVKILLLLATRIVDPLYVCIRSGAARRWSAHELAK